MGEVKVSALAGVWKKLTDSRKHVGVGKNGEGRQLVKGVLSSKLPLWAIGTELLIY